MKQLLTLLFIGLTSLYAQTVPSYVPTNGLVGWWPFNGNANDESGNGLNATQTTAQLISDRNGISNSAYQLGSGIIRIPQNSLSPSFSDSFSLSLWFTHNANSNQRLISTECPEGNFRIANWGGNGVFAIQFGGPYIIDTLSNPSQWNHLVLTYNNRISRVYINGVLVTTAQNTSNDNLNYCNPVCIGAKASSTSNDRWNGKVDDLAIWNRQISAQEIQSLYYGCADSLESHPQNFTAFSGIGWANFKCKSTDTNATYQWQQNIGSGWSNLSNFGSYSGSTSDSLVITGVTASMNNYGYRCIVTGCTTDTSDVAVLTVANGIGLGESTLDKLTISPNPTNGLVSLNISVVGNYELLTLDGRVLESGTVKKDYDLTTYPKGVYHLRLSTDEGSRVLKVVKN